MATIRLPNDFKEFLKLLNSNRVEYLVVGGYAVGYHGYPRATIDLDIWIALNAANARLVSKVIGDFGFGSADPDPALFQTENKIVRMGNPPVRIKILTSISGITFAEAYPRKVSTEIDGVDVDLIALPDLRRNKKSAARLKDRSDLEHLPDADISD